MEHGGEGLADRRVAEWMLPRDHLREHHAEGEQIGARVEWTALHLFGRHVRGRADDPALHGQLSGGIDRRLVSGGHRVETLGETEVHDLHVTMIGHHDVGRLQVPMEKSAAVRLLERFGDLPGQPQRLRQRQPAGAQLVVQRLAGDVLHHEKERLAVLANLEDLADVGVIDRRDRHRLATEALARLRVRGRLLRQQLDRDLAPEARVESTIDDAHSSSAERRQDLVRSKSSSRRKSWHDAV